jgi:hypothetical protein
MTIDRVEVITSGERRRRGAPRRRRDLSRRWASRAPCVTELARREGVRVSVRCRPQRAFLLNVPILGLCLTGASLESIFDTKTPGARWEGKR